MLKNKTVLCISYSTCPTVYVNKHLSCLTYGRVPTKGRNYVGNRNLRIDQKCIMYLCTSYWFIFLRETLNQWQFNIHYMVHTLPIVFPWNSKNQIKTLPRHAPLWMVLSPLVLKARTTMPPVWFWQVCSSSWSLHGVLVLLKIIRNNSTLRS